MRLTNLALRARRRQTLVVALVVFTPLTAVRAQNPDSVRLVLDSAHRAAVPTSRVTRAAPMAIGGSVGSIVVRTPALDPADSDERTTTLGDPLRTLGTGRAGSFSDVLQARVPGIEVFRSGGATGEGSRVRIRGRTSVLGSVEPMLVIDGIRASSVQETHGLIGRIGISRLDDLSPRDIERVEVLRGPAAAALFGPGATPGVILVTTRRGEPGPLRWSAHADGGMTFEQSEFPTNFRMRGISTSTGQPVASCGIRQRAEGSCTPTQLDAWNPLEQASPFRAGRNASTGVGASGGFGPASAPLSFYAGADLDHRTGVLDEDVHNRAGTRGALSFALPQSPVGAVEIDATAALVRRKFTPAPRSGASNDYNPLPAGLYGTAVDDANHGYLPSFSSATAGGRVARSTTSVTLIWRPLEWLEGTFRSGGDRATQNEDEDYDFVGLAAHFATHVHDNSRITSTSTALAARWSLSPSLRTRTIAALERERHRDSTFQSTTLYNPSIPGGISSTTSTTTLLTLRGTWLREELAWRDRVFLNASIRWDTWKELDDLPQKARPAFDASWIAHPDDGRLSLRLRAAHGSITSDATAQSLLFFVPVPIGGSALPPPQLEYTTESELGADVALRRRVSLSLTLFRAMTRNVVLALPLPFFSFSPTVGRVSNRGIEALLDTKLVESGSVTWDASLAASTLRNRLDALDGPPVFSLYGASSAGYPIGGYWPRHHTFADANGNRRVDAGEVSVGVERYFGGPSQPTRNASFRTSLALLRSSLRLGAVAEYHGGHKLYNATAHARCGSVVNCRAAQDTAALLGEQAAALASSMGFVDVDVQGASFAKLRELSLEWSPAAAARRLRLPSFTVSLVGRNLATWTRYGGLDPEGIASPANAVLPLDNAVLPLPRQLLLRVDVGSRRLP